MKNILKILILALAIITIAIPNQLLALNRAQRFEIERRFWYDQTDCPDGSGSGATGGNVDRFLQVLALQESGGDPRAEADTSSASGKYQYIDSTWVSRFSLYPPASQYPRASSAPEPIQDAVVKIEYEQKFKQFNNDIFKLAVSHFYPAANENPALLDITPPGNVITPREYANSIIQKMEAGEGQEIPLKYNEAPEFERYLQAAGVTSPSSPASTTTTPTTDPCEAPGGSGGDVVQIARAELAAGIKESDNSYLKYTMGRSEAWCADFVSWVFREAGKPFTDGLEGWNIASVDGIQAYAEAKNFFHPKGESGFSPRPGDVAIYNTGSGPYPSHVNIVIIVEGGSYTAIGGNQSDAVKLSTHDLNASDLTGFMRVE